MLLKLLIFSCMASESLCKMAKVNRGKETEKKREGQKYCLVSNHPTIHQAGDIPSLCWLTLGPECQANWDVLQTALSSVQGSPDPSRCPVLVALWSGAVERAQSQQELKG